MEQNTYSKNKMNILKDLISYDSNLKRPVETKKRESSVGGDSVSDSHSLLSLYVLPGYSLMHWLFIIPHKIKYDQGSRTFTKVSGSMVARVSFKHQLSQNFLLVCLVNVFAIQLFE